jgi:hypothetical protein
MVLLVILVILAIKVLKENKDSSVIKDTSVNLEMLFKDIKAILDYKVLHANKVFVVIKDHKDMPDLVLLAHKAIKAMLDMSAQQDRREIKEIKA